MTAPAPVAESADTSLVRPHRRSPLTWVRGGGLSALVLALPLLLIFGVFSWFPIGRAVLMSFQETNFVGQSTFVGLENFRNVLADPVLPIAVRNTVYFAFLALLFGYPVPLVAAVLMREVRRMRGVFTVLAYLPVVVPPVVAVMLWKLFYNPTKFGVFNTILGWFGVEPVAWLSDPGLVMPALVLQATWAAAGGTVIVYLAALTGVPSELYDAAEVDGASVWRKIWHVTMPQLRGILLITFILQIIGTAQVFLEPYLFTGGGPNNATVSILLLVFRYAFGNSLGAQYGEATALSLMLAVFLGIVSLIYFRLTERWSK